MPKVTVIIPCYNSKGMVRDAVESALSQSYKDLEIVVVDDGSDEETAGYLPADSRIRLIRQAHRGAAAARNRGTESARGEILAFLDCDDVWFPDKLEACVRELLEHPERSAVFHAYYTEDMRTGEVSRSRDDFISWKKPDRLLLSMNRQNVHPSTAVLRKACVEAVGGFDETIQICEDWDLWLRLAERFEAAYVDRPLAKVRLHGRNTILTRLGEWAENNRKTIGKALRRNPGLYEGVRREVFAEHHFWAGFYSYRLLDLPVARRHLWRSLRTRPAWRAFSYLLRSLAGRRFIRFVRRRQSGRDSTALPESASR